MHHPITQQTEQALTELIATAKPTKGSLLVIGCSSSEMAGQSIGTQPALELAEIAFEAIHRVATQHGLQLAVQCCEHLNRSLIVEQSVAEQRGYTPVNVVPHPKAGGCFATVAYQRFQKAVAVETIQADLGMDIGDTLIGMHLKTVAVPVRLSIKQIGAAHLVSARVRPKFVGGSRAIYDPTLL